METNFKPDGYNCVSPYFIVDDPQCFIDFLKTVFDGDVTRCFTKDDGQINHAEVKIMDSIVMLSGTTADYPANSLLLHVYVPDVDKVYEKALRAGCQGLEVPRNKDDDPDKRGMFQDDMGNTWAIGTQKQ
ncbi:VOC family protein [Flavobacteriaceae bacterium TP-CH-4]|uniref:VOC family protein n=1 Tax=Pelagihabitans pacificus TaxID=2696054 RepID=A0A967E4L7_9FLAO|nr:VOC family protein [Pelagihabitans pacificus]NHF58517.1 VOC family protein [Pelagihabitans pacificus]